jgi:predicted DNA-binding transcriptional regulator YafY
MTRAERLLALVAELRAAAPEPVATRDLASLLQVSERTLQRDIETLSADGLPVVTVRGRGPALAEEPQPPTLAGLASLAGPVHRTVADAVRTRGIVRISYTGHTGERTRRDVEAHGLVVAPYGEYLVGWCRLRDGPRLFRLDRIDAAYLTGGTSGIRPLDELLTTLRIPAPRRPPDDDHDAPSRARAWTRDHLDRVRLRLASLTGEPRMSRETTAAVHATLAHLAEWTRWQVAAVRAVASGEDMIFDGHRPSFPDRFDDTLDYEARERMIQEAMAARPVGEVARDLDDVLGAAARWTAASAEVLWTGLVPDPAQPGRHRRLADLLAGLRSPVSHVEWHLDRLSGGTVTAPHDGPRAVAVCPLRT